MAASSLQISVVADCITALVLDCWLSNILLFYLNIILPSCPMLLPQRQVALYLDSLFRLFHSPSIPPPRPPCRSMSSRTSTWCRRFGGSIYRSPSVPCRRGRRTSSPGMSGGRCDRTMVIFKNLFRSAVAEADCRRTPYHPLSLSSVYLP